MFSNSLTLNYTPTVDDMGCLESAKIRVAGL